MLIAAISEYLNYTWLYWGLWTVYFVTILSVIVIIVSENRNPVKSLAWVTVLLVVPVLGLVLYIVFGRNIQSKHVLSRRNRRILRCLGEQKAYGNDPNWKFSAEQQQLARMARTLNASVFYTGNDARIFSDGAEKFEALLADIASARKFIHLQYYIIEDDKIGRRVKDALIAKSREGVTIRIIYDHVGSFRTPRRFFKDLTDAGVKVYPFFKVAFPPFGSHINWRNHRKLCVIDGKIGYIGGMNIADRYAEGVKWGVWRDTHLRVEGPVVAALLRSFAVDWNFMGNELLREVCEAKPQEANMGMQMITSGPTSQWATISLVFLKAISTARKRVFIMTPYFLPTQSLLEALQSAALAGIDVRVMMPRRSDSAMLRYASFSYVAECLRTGIKIYLYEDGMLHSKAMIIDDDIATVGSTNFDFRSFEHNFEGNMMVYSRTFNARMRQIFAEDLARCTRVTSNNWKRRPMLDRALSSFMRLFSPIL